MRKLRVTTHYRKEDWRQEKIPRWDFLEIHYLDCGFSYGLGVHGMPKNATWVLFVSLTLPKIYLGHFHGGDIRDFYEEMK